MVKSIGSGSRSSWLAASLPAFAVAVTALAGCMPISDPTENEVGIQLRNDFARPAVLTACEDAMCHSQPGTVRDHLAPGKDLAVNVGTDGVPTYYSVSLDRQPRRCLTLVVHGRPTHSVVPLSSSRVCR
jgi:hypothetical protein